MDAKFSSDFSVEEQGLHDGAVAAAPEKEEAFAHGEGEEEEGGWESGREGGG